ncbi:hypothetical protein TUM19329_28440 [Legionella antarctica]|uniref:Uncharacterized protein n=1 Tax=Legionella antarctica TaxID=2708020 RepID=A0A6F8T8E7_9GAMM|nr:hypothetical protein [Legionella antarctica]BCA96483.1 hypothetical protein TUM19329_28440 [Legionella antarctica]
MQQEEIFSKQKEEQLRIQQEEIFSKQKEEQLRIQQEQLLMQEEERLSQQEEKKLRMQQEQLLMQKEERLSQQEEKKLRMQQEKPGTTANAVPNPFELEFKQKIDLLTKKMIQFQDEPNHKDAFDAASLLYDKLKEEGDDYFGNPPTRDSYQEFKKNCEGHIKTARLELDNHRGWTKIILNVIAIVLSAGIGYLFAAGVNMAVNKGKFTFFSTDSSLVIDEIEDSINKSKPTP